MKTLSSGPDGTIHPGAIISVSNEEAKDLIEGNFAELVEEVETKPIDEKPEGKQVKKDAANNKSSKQ